MFVLDEADEMLSRGFKDQIYDVFRHLDSKIQVWISSIVCVTLIPCKVYKHLHQMMKCSYIIIRGPYVCTLIFFFISIVAILNIASGVYSA